MTAAEWKELDRLGREKIPADGTPTAACMRYFRLLERTREHTKHPEDYEGTCLCNACVTRGN